MKKFLSLRVIKAVTALAGLLLLTACAQPDFYDTEGNGYQLSDFEGRYQVINYWATWCAPCIKEIPELIELDENHDNIVVFGVNFDGPEPEEMARQIERMKITFPVYQHDPWQRLGIDKPEVLPTTVIVAPSGQVIDTLIGPQTEASLLAAMGLPE